ncbi:MAG: hypothetical protein Q8P36_01195 [bacterium]|nr:hypothetical protein [bacterium]
MMERKPKSNPVESKEEMPTITDQQVFDALYEWRGKGKPAENPTYLAWCEQEEERLKTNAYEMIEFVLSAARMFRRLGHSEEAQVTFEQALKTAGEMGDRQYAEEIANERDEDKASS